LSLIWVCHFANTISGDTNGFSGNELRRQWKTGAFSNAVPVKEVEIPGQRGVENL